MRKHQCGAAVIVAILIVMLATSTAAFAVWQQSLWVRQLENINDRAKADQLAISGIDIARDTLKRDDRNMDYLNEPWAQAITLPAEEALVSGQITDQQGRFNLNNLIKSGDAVHDKQTLQVFERLLDSLKLPIELATAVADWINEDPNGTADLYYLSLNPPYRAAQRLLADTAELARIKGFDENSVSTLMPFVTALGKPTPVNVNTASVEVLSALFNDPSIAKTLASKTPLKTTSDVQQTLPRDFACTNCYDVKSEYFTATVRVKSGRVEAGYTALLHRDPAPSWPVILWRKDAAD